MLITCSAGPHLRCFLLLCAQGLIFNELRSKTKTFESDMGLDPSAYPDWSYDGSSTGQAAGSNSDCILRWVVFPSSVPSLALICRQARPRVACA